jgi:capsular exopolysaccharide synthesis family protein
VGLSDGGARAGRDRHRTGGPEYWAEEPVDLRRYVDALRRSRFLIICIIVPMTAAAFIASRSLPKVYSARALIVMQEPTDPLAGSDAASVARRLATAQTLLETPVILDDAARRLSMSEHLLEDKVSSSIDANANVITITAKDGDPARAAAIANAVATSFVHEQQSAETLRVSRARARLVALLGRLRRSPGAEPEIAAIRQELSALAVAEATSGSDFELARAAERPSSPSSPHPLRNSIVAFFAAIVLAVLAAVARLQLVPRPRGPGDVSRLTDLPLLVKVPYVRRRFRRRPDALTAVEHEAYRTLETLVTVHLPPNGQHTILVTSALRGEGKTHVVAALGRALAHAGYRVLLVSGDLRSPRLHEHFHLDGAPGLSDLLSAASRAGGWHVARELQSATSATLVRGRGKGDLRLLPSGQTPIDPAGSLSGDALGAVFNEITLLDYYQYVLVDGPPILGHADSHILARNVETVLVVTRLDRVSVENLSDMRETIDRLGVSTLGVIIIGTRADVSEDYVRGGFAMSDGL